MAGHDMATGTGRAGHEPPADDLTARAWGGVLVADETLAEDALAGDGLAGDALAGDAPAGYALAEELLVEEISIDGMCGVY
jgi:mycofactocin precursor